MSSYRQISFALAVSAAILCLSCGSAARSVRDQGGMTIDEPQSDYCFLGSSDPWVDNVDTWAEAGQEAVKNLFDYYRSVSVRSGAVSFTDNAGIDYADKLLISEIKSTLSGARVVGWWFDRDGSGPAGMCGRRCKSATVWAVACVDGHLAEAHAVLPEAFRGDIPSWLKNQKSYTKKYCAVGISGRTVKPEDALANATADARRRVAIQICAVGDHAFIDYLSGGTYSFPDSRATPAAEAYIAGMAGTEGESVVSWLDADGRGPLHTRGAAYAKVCVPRAQVPCAGE